MAQQQRDPCAARTPTLQWRLRRNCALAPGPTLLCFAALCAFNAALGAVFALLGYPIVLLFMLTVDGAFAIALLAYARHAGDCETLTLQGDHLTIECRCGTAVTRCELRAARVRVAMPRDAHDLVALHEHGRCIEVGRHVPPPLRPHMVRELRHALAGHSLVGR